MNEVNGNAVADAIKARLFSMPSHLILDICPENTLNRNAPYDQSPGRLQHTGTNCAAALHARSFDRSRVSERGSSGR